jgi:hypothetical protein
MTNHLATACTNLLARLKFWLARRKRNRAYRRLWTKKAAKDKRDWVGERGTYSPRADLAANINECYRVIRERIANGGPGWTPRDPPKVASGGVRAASWPRTSSFRQRAGGDEPVSGTIPSQVPSLTHRHGPHCPKTKEA